MNDLPPQSEYRWYHKLTGVLLVILYFEIGLFLIFFPWSDFWKPNLLGNLSPEWGLFWLNPFFRGAVSGLGAINIYLSVLEAFSLRRFSQQAGLEAIDHNE